MTSMKTSAKNQECVIFIFITIVIVLVTNLTGYADITPVNDRTSEVRDAIVAAVPGVNNAANVTAAHLAAITSLNLRGKGISVLKTNDFSGLNALTSLNLYNNKLSNLPEGIFEGLTSLTTIRLSRNAIDPLPFTVSLEKVAEGEFKAIAPTGALFDIVLPITVTNGNVTAGSTTLTIPHGSVESSTLTVTRTVGTTAHVTVNIGTLPSLPRNHFGYALVKSDTLPLTIISGTNTAPVFTEGASTTRSIAENTTTGQNIGTAVSATDAENDTLTYTLSGTDASTFNIGSDTGQLKTKAALDYENKNTYTVTITVSDGSLSDTIAVTINITDIHEVVAPPPNSAPVFTEGSSTTRTIAENTPTGQNIGTAVAATDADEHLLTYSLSGPDASSFSIVSASGQLQTRAALDYEIKTSYAATITVSDGRLTDSVAVTINVTDVDETTIGPRFVPLADRTPEVRDAIVNALPNISNAEEVTKTHVATIRDLNLRNAGILALKAGDFSGMTALTSLNLFNNQLSSLPSGIFEGLTSLKTVRLGQSVADPLPFTVSLEKVGAGAFKAVAPAGALFRIVLPITVTNGSVMGGAAMLTIPQGGMESATLTVTRTAGTTAHVTVDIGTLPSLPRTHYGYGLIKPDSLPLVIVRGSNTAPVFRDGTTATRSVAEETAIGVNIGAPVSARDTDGDTLTYSFSGIDASTFSINSSTGQLQARAILDYETKASYSVTVTASDSYGGSDSITVTINVTDIDENRSPVFTEGNSASRMIAENTASGQHIGRAVSATDADNDTLTYILNGTDAASFDVDSTSGQLETKAALDYETKASYSVTVAVSDGNGGSDSITVAINVTDVHENRAPVFIDGKSTTRTIAENTASRQKIGRAVSATDADKDTLNYTLSGPDAASFSIDSTSGQLQTKAALDYNTKTAYSVTVAVSDGNGGSDSITVTIRVTVAVSDGNGGSDSITVTINVPDVRENRAPVFTEGSTTTRAIAENTEAGSNIGEAVSATDQDANDKLTYTLSGTDAAAFDIDSTTGQIKTKASLDYETKNNYSVTLTVSDGLATDTITVTISVTNIDENRAPVFTEGSSATRTMAENTTAGTKIGKAITATDPDNDQLTYRIAGQDASMFRINTKNGQLSTNVALDYEAKSVYVVSVYVSDGKLTAIIAVTINITDVDDLTDAIFVSAINFVPVNHPRFINNPWIGGGRVKLDPAKHNRELATYYEYSLSHDLLGGLPEGFIKTIYENREHEGRLVITPYSRLAITHRDYSHLATFFEEHEFELRDEKGQIVPTYNDYKNGKFHVEVQGLDNFIKDSIVIQPKAYLGGGLIESINRVYTLKIIHKLTKRTIFAKECITLFESSPFLLLQICAVPEGWEDADGAGEKDDALPEYYNFHPEYYHWVRRTTVAYDSYYFNEIVGKSYIEGYNQFPIRVEIHPDDPNYAQGWAGMAYGNGLRAEIDKIRETVGHQGVLREVYHLYHTEHKSAPIFGWKSWSGENAPRWTQVINADAVGGMRQRVRINQFTDYNHEVGHTFNLGHNAGASMLYTWKGYNSLCYWKILPYFYEIKGTKGKGVLRKNEQGTWVGDSQNVIILPGGFYQPLTKIKIQGDNIVLPMEKIGPVNEGLKGEELRLQNERIIAQQVSQNDALYFFEPDQSGQYKLTFYYTPVNSDVYGDLVVQVHAESIEDALENLSRNPHVKVSSRKTLVRDTVMLTAKNPISKKDDNFSLQNMTFQKGRSYAIFIHYEMTENDDKKFKEGSLIFQRIEVTNNVGQIAVETLPNLAPVFTDGTSTTRSLANFPNPFNPETWIPYQLAKPAEVTLTIYDMRGVVVRTIALGHKTVGVYTSRSRAIHWDGRNMIGEKVAAGLYFYTLTAGDFTATRKMLIRK